MMFFTKYYLKYLYLVKCKSYIFANFFIKSFVALLYFSDIRLILLILPALCFFLKILPKRA